MNTLHASDSHVIKVFLTKNGGFSINRLIAPDLKCSEGNSSEVFIGFILCFGARGFERLVKKFSRLQLALFVSLTM